MVKSIEYAQRKWERKTAGKGATWKSRTEASIDLACKNFAAFIGKATPKWCEAYRSGVGAVSAGDFEAAIRGKGAKWGAKMRAIE